MRSAAAKVLGVMLALTACDRFPRDSRDTLERVEHGELRVGVIEHAPWAFGDDGPEGGPRGADAELVRGFAEDVHAHVTWRRGPAGELFISLERGELDLVIGGIRKDTPWKKRVALTRPYYADRVIASSPGENALLLRLERAIEPRRKLVNDFLTEASR